MNDLNPARKEAMIKQGLDILLTRAWLMQHRNGLSREHFERLLNHNDPKVIAIWNEGIKKFLNEDIEGSKIERVLKDYVSNMKKQEAAIEHMVESVRALESKESSRSDTEDYNDVFTTGSTEE